MKRAPWSLVRTNPATEPAQWSAADDWTRALEGLSEAEELRQRLAHRLADDLHSLVPLADAAERRALLAARRQLHGGKPVVDPSTFLAALTRAVERGCTGSESDAVLQRARTVCAAEESARIAHLALNAAIEERLGTERAGLREVLATAEVRHATAFSAAGLARAVDSYVAAGPGPNKRGRKKESRLLRFAERAVGRTSPFSTYTVVGRSHWADVPQESATPTGESETATPPESISAAGPRKHRVEVNRVLMLRLLDAAARHPEIRAHWPHRAARIVRQDNESVVVEQHLDAPVQQPRVFATRTSRTTVRRSPLVDIVLDALASESLSPAELASRIAGDDPRGIRAVDQLVDNGLLVPSLPVEDHAADPIADTRRIIVAAASGADGTTGRASDLLWALDAGLATVAGAVDAVRCTPESAGIEAADLVEACGTAIDDTFAVLGVDRPAGGFAVYEDVVLTQSQPQSTASWAPVLNDLDSLVSILPAFDNLAITRAAIRTAFLSSYGAGARRPLRDLVELLPSVFEAASGSLSDAVAELAASDPAAAAALGPRAELADAVRRAGLAGQETFALDRDWIQRAVDAVPQEHREGRSYAVFAQRTSDRGAVINEVYGGRGQFTSRFLGLWGEDALAEVKDWVRSVTPEHAAELRPVHGFNANVHPPMIDRQLHAATAPATGEDLGIDELSVVDDPASGTLRLEDADGTPVHPVYLGLLVPFLLPFEVAVYYVLGDAPLVQLDPAGEADDDLTGADRTCVRSYPRVTLGSLVLSRRAWAVPAAQIPLPPAGGDPVEAAAELLRWRLRHDIPADCFVTAMAEPAEPEPGQELDPGERLRTQLAAMTAKPLRVRWDSPLHLAQVRSWFGDAPALWITETLPVPGQTPGEPSCTEHVLELATDPATDQAPNAAHASGGTQLERPATEWSDSTVHQPDRQAMKEAVR